jgi:hypothetical protein
MDLLSTAAIIGTAALIYLTIKTSADAFFNRRDRW